MLIDPRSVMQELGLSLQVDGRRHDAICASSSRFEPQAQYNVGDLLNYSGEEFVDVAYRAVLRRFPDDAGRRVYLDALETGLLSKIEVLGAMRSSVEGLHAGVVIHGLRLRFFLRRMTRKGFAGRVLRWLMVFARLDQLPPKLDALDAQLASRDDRADSRWTQSIAVAREDLRKQIANSAHALRKYVGRNEGESVRRLEELAGRMEEMEARHQGQLAEVTAELERRALLPPAGASTDELAAMYVRLEAVFRGGEDEIRRRSEVYLPYIAEASQSVDSKEILDLGCGRGELLGLLTDKGYEPRGIDLNPLFIQDNLDAGRKVALLDALTALEECEPSSLLAITSIHLVEHLPVEILVKLLDLAWRALRPGGKLILETPNPQNLRTSAYYFYFDPTHRNPIPPPLLSWLVGDRGFGDVRIDPLNDGRFSPETTHLPGDAIGADQVNRFVDWLSASPDYAVIATKPL